MPRSWAFLAACSLAAVGFAAGRITAAPEAAATVGTGPAGTGAPSLVLVQGPADPRELIPLPGPDGLDGPAIPAECLLLDQDGPLEQLVPAPGDGPPPGFGGPQELIPLEPLAPQRGPTAPRLPPPPADPPGTLRTGIDAAPWLAQASRPAPATSITPETN